ncbi:MAG: HK97 family phage prohead protease [Nocardioidaceae bacterium]
MTTTMMRHGAAVLERRLRPFGDTDVQLIRAADDQQADPRFTGHAAVFDSRTAIGNPLKWGWYEQIASSAFDKTLTETDARFLVDHNSSLLVARMTAGDLRLSKDATGLVVDADLDVELSYVRDLVRNLEKRRLTGMSFGFYVVKDSVDTETVSTSDGQDVEVEVRTLLEVRLLEVSAVTFPAYEETDAGLRSTCGEVRAARHQTSTSAQEVAPEPGESTRGEGCTEPGESTPQALRLATMRQDALAARYLLGR